MVLLEEKDYVKVLCNIGGAHTREILFPDNSKIRFFRDKPYLLKHDIQVIFALNNPEMFTFLDEDVQKAWEKKIGKPTKKAEEPVPKKVEEKYTSKSLIELKKSNLITILKKLGAKKIPTMTRNKIALILELQGSK